MPEMMPVNAYRYEAFISYRHVEPDMSAATALHQSIERFTIPPSIRNQIGKKKMGRVFRDSEELPTSNDLGRDIEDALINSKWLIVVCSPRLLESRWCMREVDFFIEQGRRNQILTILIEDEPEASFPPQLRFMDVDGQTVEIEPLAADIRAETDKERLKLLKREKLRLLAPMLGVTFDDLYQRAKKYTRRRILTAFASVAAVLAVFGAVMGYQAMQIAQANRFAALEQVTSLIGNSTSAIRNQDQNAAVNAARQSLELARQHNLNEQNAAAAMYHALVHFPTEGSYARLQHHGEAIETAFSPDGTRVAVVTDDNRITIWDTKHGTKKGVIELTPDHYMISYDFESLFVVNPMDWSAICFNGDNELFVLDLTNKELKKYGEDGRELAAEKADFGYSLDIQRYVWGEDFPFFKPKMAWLPGADAVIVNCYAAKGEYGYSTQSAFFAFDGKTGKTLLEEGDGYDWLEGEGIHPIAIQISSDGESAACYYLGNQFRVVTLSETSIRHGEPHQYSFLPRGSVYYYLYDSIFLTSKPEGFVVLDAETMEEYPVPELVPSPEEDYDYANYSILLEGRQPGEFYAGYYDSVVNYYAFDGEKVTYLHNEFDVEYDTYDGNRIYRFGWANKETGTVTFISDLFSENRCRRVVLGNGLIYHDYEYSYAKGGIPGSNHGFSAELDGNTCLLYNYNEYSNDFVRRALKSRNQPGIAYVDPAKGLLIAENYDSEGFFFEVNTFDGAHTTPLHKVYLPDTGGYNPYTDEAPYNEVIWGKDYAAILVGDMGGGNDDTDHIPYTLYAFYYSDGILRASDSWEDDDPNIICINEQYIATASYYANAMLFDSDNLRRTEIDLREILPQAWFDEKNPFVPNKGGLSSSPNLLWPYFIREDIEGEGPFYYKLAYLDMVNREYIESDTDFTSNINSESVWWSDSGDICYFLDDDGHFSAYDITSMELLPREDFPEDIAKIKKLDDDILAFVSSENAVEFYDMDSCKRISTMQGDYEAVLNISYNPASGLAVITRRSAYEIYDIRAGEYYCAPIFFSKPLESNQVSEIYITNDGRSLLECVRMERVNEAGIKRYWYNYILWDLLNADELIEAALPFNGDK